MIFLQKKLFTSTTVPSVEMEHKSNILRYGALLAGALLADASFRAAELRAAQSIRAGSGLTEVQQGYRTIV